MADLRADLLRHRAALAKLQGELMASRLEVSGAREETAHYKIFLRQAEADIEELRDRAADLEQLRGHSANQDAEITGLNNHIDALHTSLSWRISAPIRVAGKLLRRG